MKIVTREMAKNLSENFISQPEVAEAYRRITNAILAKCAEGKNTVFISGCNDKLKEKVIQIFVQTLGYDIKYSNPDFFLCW